LEYDGKFRCRYLIVHLKLFEQKEEYFNIKYFDLEILVSATIEFNVDVYRCSQNFECVLKLVLHSAAKFNEPKIYLAFICSIKRGATRINTIIQVMNQRPQFCLLELCNPHNWKSVIIMKLS